MSKPPASESSNYKDGWADGQAGRDPEFERLALGANSLNDYERGYIDGGRTLLGLRVQPTRRSSE